MLKLEKDIRVNRLDRCHEGIGITWSKALLSSGESKSGFKHIHDSSVEVGGEIGVHIHGDDEEVYYVIEGEGILLLNGERISVRPGDFSLVGKGESHGVINTGDVPLRLMVISSFLQDTN